MPVEAKTDACRNGNGYLSAQNLPPPNCTKHKSLPNLPKLPWLQLKQTFYKGRAAIAHKHLYINILQYK